MYKLDRSSLDLLKSLIGVKSQLLYTDRIITHYGETTIEGEFFCIKTDESKCVKIGFHWSECQDTLLDYSLLSAHITEFNIAGCCSIFSFEDTSKYVSAKIISLSHEEEEDLVFHAGFILERSDGKRILIHGGGSAFRNAKLEHDPLIIDDFLSKAIDVINLC